MVRLVIAAVVLVMTASAAWAQSPPTRMPRFGEGAFTIPVVIYDAAGNVVPSFGGGSGASPASSSIAVQRTGGIGTTGTLVSAADATSRRTVQNLSQTVDCEIVPALGGAYGTGFPLGRAGGVLPTQFTFDASGRTTAALYVACASAGGTVAVLSY